MTSHPSLDYDFLGYINTVDVSGAEAKGKGKKSAHARVSLPPKHPMSPQSMRRNGEPRYMTQFVKGKNLKRDSECAEKGREVLAKQALYSIESSFDGFVIPHLEEGDSLRVKTSAIDFTFSPKQWTIPLTPDGTMSFGYTKRVRRRKRRKKPRVHGSNSSRYRKGRS